MFSYRSYQFEIQINLEQISESMFFGCTQSYEKTSNYLVNQQIIPWASQIKITFKIYHNGFLNVSPFLT